MTATRRRPAYLTTGTSGAYRLLVALVVILNLFGLVMVLSSSSVQAVAESGSTWPYFTRQVMWLSLGTVAFIVGAVVDHRVWRAAIPYAYAATIAALIAVLLAGVTVNGATRWIEIGPARLQPSEFAKLTLVLFCAHLLDLRSHCVHDHRRSMNPVLLGAGPILGLILVEPDLGTTIIGGVIVVTALVVAGVPWRPLLLVSGAGTAAAIALAFGAEYRRERLLAFWNPWSDPQGITYQPLQSLVGLASGGPFGLGLGESRAKWGFLPNAHTDFIFAVIGEELGMAGALLVVALFGAFVAVGLRVALGAPDLYGAVLAATITAWIGLQAVVNMGGVTSMLPITGVTLPFVSFGGSSLIVTMAATGILANVARQVR